MTEQEGRLAVEELLKEDVGFLVVRGDWTAP